MTPAEILDAADALGHAGCTDASVRGHADGIELLFERNAESLQAAISSQSRQPCPRYPSRCRPRSPHVRRAIAGGGREGHGMREHTS